MDDVARRVGARVDEMLIIDRHRLNHDASRAPAPIGRFDRIREDHGRVITQLKALPQIVRERKGFTIDVPPNPPKGGGKGADRASDPTPDVVGSPIQLNPSSTECLDKQLTVDPLLPHGQRQVLDRRDMGRKTRVTRAVLALSDNEHKVDVLTAAFGRQRPRH